MLYSLGLVRVCDVSCVMFCHLMLLSIVQFAIVDILTYCFWLGSVWRATTWILVVLLWYFVSHLASVRFLPDCQVVGSPWYNNVSNVYQIWINPSSSLHGDKAVLKFLVELGSVSFSQDMDVYVSSSVLVAILLHSSGLFKGCHYCCCVRAVLLLK